MKVLILANGTGGGHMAAAYALQEAFEARGHEATVLDPFSLLGEVRGKLKSGFVNNLYIRSVQFVPHLFGFVYSLGAMYWRLFRNVPQVKSPVYYSNRSVWKPLEALFQKEQYDAVLTTHLYPGEIMAGMRAHGYKVPPTYWISTDYDCIPFTEEAACDHYIIAHPELVPDYLHWHIPEERIYPLGIPVRAKFAEPATREQAKRELGLNLDKHYFLISGGSVGSGKLVEAVTLLATHYRDREDVEFIAICGKNEWIYRQMKKLFPHKVHMLRHTDRMAEYMRACDAVITKPGGLSSTEAAVTGTALIFISPIPGGPETANVRFFERHGMAIYAETVALELTDLVQE
ncbi:MAG: glycosyl transferase, partial [Clostridia bacterium]|nr:glycosyl transferase [Clostridia bacterium]